MTELTAVARAMTDPIWLTPDELHQLTGTEPSEGPARSTLMAPRQRPA